MSVRAFVAPARCRALWASRRAWVAMQAAGAWALALLLVAAAPVGCASRLAGPGSVSTLQRHALPEVEDALLSAWHVDAGEPAGEAERLLASYEWQLREEPARALDVLLEGVWGERYAWARWLRLYDLRSDVPAYEERVAPLLDTPAPEDLLALLLRNEVAAELQWRAQRGAGVGVGGGGLTAPPDLSAWGVPERWALLGPVAPWPLRSYATVTVPPTPLPPSWEAPGPAMLRREVAGRLQGMELPLDAPGVWWLESHVTVDADMELLLVVGQAGPYRVWVGEQEVLARGPDQVHDPWLQARRVAVPQGTHVLRVWLGYAGGDRHWVFRAIPLGPAAGAIRVTWTEGLETAPLGSVPSPEPRDAAIWMAGATPASRLGLGWLLAAELAVALGDLPAVEALLLEDAAPVDPLSHYWRSRLFGALTSAPMATREGLRMGALEQAAEARHAAAARLGRAWALLGQGRRGAALEAARQLAAEHPESPNAQSLLGAAWREEGAHELALEAYRRAWALYPQHCGLVRAWITIALGWDRVFALEDLPVEWRACDVAHEAEVMTRLRPEGRWREALERSRWLWLRSPWQSTLWEAWWDAALASGDVAAQREALEAGRRAGLSPLSLAQLGWEADFGRAHREGRGASALVPLRVSDAAGEGPETPAQRGRRALLWQEPVVSGGWIDGDRVIDGYLATEPEERSALGSPLVYVLDHATHVWQPDGSVLTYVHQIAEVRTREALEWVGEVGLPGGESLVVALRTRKRDGRTYRPVLDGQRSAVSMPEVEVGDFVEWAFVRWDASWAPGSGLQALTPFYLETPDAWLWRSEVVHEVHPALVASLVFWTQGEGVVEEVEALAGGGERRRFSRDAARPVVAEPMGPPAGAFMVHVRPQGVSQRALISKMEEERLARLVAPSEALRRQAASLVGGLRGEAAWRVLYRWVMDTIDDTAVPLSQDAASTFWSRSGDRTSLLVALLSMVPGTRVEVFAVQPFGAEEGPWDPFAEYGWQTPVLRVRDGRAVAWLEPGTEDMPFGYLSVDLQERPALRLWPQAGEEAIATPRWPRETWIRRITVAGVVRPDGGVEGTWREAVPLRLEASFRGYFRRMSDETSLRQQLEGDLAATFPGVRVLWARVEGLEDPEARLVVHFGWEAPSGMALAGGELRWEGTVLPRALGRAYGSLAQRRHPLVVQPLWEEVELRLRAPEGWRWGVTPRHVGEGVVWEQRSEVEEGGALLRWRRILRVGPAMVPPQGYPGVASELRAAEEGSRERWVILPASSAVEERR